MFTIDDLVLLFHPNYVAINNPTSENGTLGDTIVSSFQVDCDEVDGIMMYVTVAQGK